MAWVLRTIEERGILAVAPSEQKAPGAWGEEIRTMTGVVRRARQTAWLEAVSYAWPGDDSYVRLNADRMGFYRNRVTAAARYLRQILIAPSADDIVQALSERFFEPSQDWKLFEIAVLMRITRALGEIGERIGKPKQFTDNGRGPFARFHINPNREVRVWYQSWPPSSAPTELGDAVKHYKMFNGGNRPDIVIELVEAGNAVRVIILELKASTSGSYLSSGFSQLLGYLRDRPELTSEPMSGWLVAPAGDGYKSRDPEGRALWVVSSENVAPAVQSVVLGCS
ncbi:hypothetical protein [Paenarthrobacter ureafaciens]|uniref:hypothetical protein n=1 Tax=Paenarthrobacter ureafaciens TaxID=37931 RepID=UPI001FB228D5|nr:hypothetical protein [Paenarthrobacter ureafaciens]UOD83473.1 hypothetical protein MQZ73_20770 [Paenarthrobacter ureafaciens]